MNNQISTIIRASWIAVIGNIILSVLKIVIGIFSGSLAVLADGTDSASDIVTSLITYFTARIMRRPPNPKFPYGYHKADTIATKALSFIILFAGLQLAINTITNLVAGKERQIPDPMAIYVTIISIIGKIFLSVYLFRKGKETSSSMLKANARNMQNDILISFTVLVGLIFTFIFHMPILDSIVALSVSIWIIKVGIQIFLQTDRDLMDGVSDPELYKKVFCAIDRIPEAHHPHRLRIRKIGNYYMIAMDIEVDGSLTTSQAHQIVCNIEQSIRKEILNIFDIIIHVEPIGTKEKEENYGISKQDLLCD